MPETSRIIGLSEDYPLALCARQAGPCFLNIPPGFKVMRYRPGARQPAGMLRDQLPPRIDLSDYITTDELAASYERLASMVMARKLSDDATIGPLERYQLCNLAGVPEGWRDHDWTDMLFLATPEQLGKGGFFGGIANTINKVVAPVAKVVSKVAASTGKLVSAVAPVLSVVPVVGPEVSKLAGFAGAALQEGSTLSLKSVVTNPAGIMAGITAEAQGVMAAGGMGADVAAQQGVDQSFMQSLGQAVGGVAQGVQGVAGAVASAPVNLLSGLGSAAMGAVSSVQGLISGVCGGTQTAPGGFTSDFWQGLKASDPGIGQLASSIEAAMGGAPAGSYIAKLGNTFASFTKSPSGQVSVNQHPPGTVPGSIANNVPTGQLVPIDPSLLGTQRQPAGNTGAFQQATQGNPNGVAMDAAGVSLPGGPNNGAASIPYDSSSMGLLKDAMSDAIAGSAVTKAAKPVKAGGSSSLLWLGGGGLALSGYFMYTKSGRAQWSKIKRGLMAPSGRRRRRR
jgi:hypothetical protein